MNKLPVEAEYLLKIIRGVINVESISAPPDNLNYERIFKTAKAHGVTSIVYEGLCSNGAILPDEIQKSFSTANKLMMISSAARNSAADDLCVYFEENNIDYIFLKGSILQKLYPKKHMRYSADIDVLVRENDFKRASDLLKKFGYKLSSRSEKHDVFINPPYICIELHRSLSYDEPFFKDVWKYASYNDKNSMELSKEFQLIYLVFHSAKNFKKTAGIGIHSVIDLWLFMKNFRKELDMDFVYSVFEKLTIKTYFDALLSLTEVWFSDNESDEFSDKLTLAILSGNRTGNISNAVSANSEDGKIKFVFNRVFLPYNEMKRAYPSLKKIPIALPFYYIGRISALIFKKRHHGIRRLGKVLKKQKNSESISQLFKELGL